MGGIFALSVSQTFCVVPPSQALLTSTVEAVDREEPGAGGPKTELSDERLKEIYRLMLLVRAADKQAVTLQRQGRVGFYVPCSGEEAAEVGSTYAMKAEDWAFTDYRSSGVVLTRGLSLTRFFAQLMARSEDVLKGRGMPSHWGSKEINVLAPSSNICTQLPHAVGVALGAKMKGDKVVTVSFFGDGGTSSNDFHSALNFAGVTKAPTVFFCRNNGYAISLPVSRQTASKSLAIKADAYGIEGIQVDGNDVLAVHSITRKALEKARNGGGPTLIEAITYRISDHSTSDDAKRYRGAEEVESWKLKDPITRFKAFLEGRGLWDEAQETSTSELIVKEIKEAVEHVERLPQPDVNTLFDDVYDRPTWNLERQAKEVEEELRGD